MRCTLIKSGSISIKFSCLVTRMNAEVGNITFVDTKFFIIMTFMNIMRLIFPKPEHISLIFLSFDIAVFSTCYL